MRLPELEECPAYVFRLIHREAAILEKKSARLGGFDATRFRDDTLRYLEEITVRA